MLTRFTLIFPLSLSYHPLTSLCFCFFLRFRERKMCGLWVFHWAWDRDHNRKHGKYSQWVNRIEFGDLKISWSISNTHLTCFVPLQKWCGQLHHSLWCLCSLCSLPSSSATWAIFARSAPSWHLFPESFSSCQVLITVSFILKCCNFSLLDDT